MAAWRSPMKFEQGEILAIDARQACSGSQEGWFIKSAAFSMGNVYFHGNQRRHLKYSRVFTPIYVLGQKTKNFEIIIFVELVFPSFQKCCIIKTE
ncbi:MULTISPECIES: hypothetical protein [Heyndrickxia]|uniref:hypothetical protein n=1 Tax=Heyndrickxia TaxID=2837504 RepID=UPI0005070870|nr:hypothetical protein [Heyndrickxia coagulans]ATW81796.1 hypothetical protein CIW84_01570 [Heyndrickxia coagulans]KGB29738.1 hypothetical protein IE89_09295 [Heyndrickxia coagulans]KXT22019.1 hypothetical protein UZ35_01175 [Heyndrickxia coagulans]MCU6437843.1 hypothetical protein [Heyndrickxia coagulans]NEV23053.1 hypothetical protein [Heyndrickxia coagulans]